MNIKDSQSILQKLGIDALNPMQLKAAEAIKRHNEIVLLSNTGTGKTLAFLLPLIEQLDNSINGIQLLILVPSRELAIQIEQVIREMGSGYKANAVYGGRAGSKDRIELKHAPSILIGTPGRVADHMRNATVDPRNIKTLVLDEFDKILEVGFADEMKEILSYLRKLRKKILTSATKNMVIPDFLELKHPHEVNFIKEANTKLKIKSVACEDRDKLETLSKLLLSTQDQNGIVFCNFKDSVNQVSHFLNGKKIDHACFYGGLEQSDRERSLIQFRNGSHRVLIATDLAARGIDVPELDFIIHFELPSKIEEFTHRNGRTARVNAEGVAYVLKWSDRPLPAFIVADETHVIQPSGVLPSMKWVTLFISGGRRDKISKGDIAGLFFKQGQLKKDELGLIELKQDCAYVAVPQKKSATLIQNLNNSRLKTKKVRISRLKD